MDDTEELAAAIEMGELGYEAALLVGRIASPDTIDAWIDRAKSRTVLDLRTEVEAVEQQANLDSRAPPPPAASRPDGRYP